MSAVSTHVLDTSLGRPAGGVPVSLEMQSGGDGWVKVGAGITDTDGRIVELVSAGERLQVRRYRLVFDTAGYFRSRGVAAFYPVVVVVFEVTDPAAQHHLPLLLSPFGYSTYRGS